MKIYILNVLPSSLKSKLEKLFLLYESQIKLKYEVVSKEFGIITIEEQKITCIESTFNTNYEIIKNYNNCNLLIDRTNNNKIPLNSQFPVDYIYTKFIQLEFKTHKKSKLSLIIDCLEEPDNFELIRIPVDFYFDYNSDIIDLNDRFFQEEFNMFLSNVN